MKITLTTDSGDEAGTIEVMTIERTEDVLAAIRDGLEHALGAEQCDRCNKWCDSSDMVYGGDGDCMLCPPCVDETRRA